MMRLAIAGIILLAASPTLAQVIYDASPRIIHVQPQGSAYGAVSAAPAVRDESDDEIIERIERRKVQQRRPFWKQPPEPKPRPRVELPPAANESKRALLSAPPPEVGPGSLTPIYPTPRWRNADPPPEVAVDNNE